MWKFLEKCAVVAVLLLSTGAVAELFLLHLAGDYSGEGDPRAQLMWLVIYVALLMAFVIRGRQFAAVIAQNKLLLALLIVALLSTAWSAAPAVTLRRAIALVGSTMFGVYLAARFRIPDQLRLLAYAIALAAVLSLACGVFFPNSGIMHGELEGMWRGVFAHKNVLGRIMALGVVVFAMSFTGKRKLVSAGAICLCLGLIYLSKSHTAALVLAALIAVTPIYRALRMRMKIAVPVIAFALLLAFGGAFLLSGHLDEALSAMHRNRNFTGRTELWAYSADQISQHPLLGFGYSAFWTVGNGHDVETVIGWAPPHSHNGFLDLMLDLGVVGLALFMAIFAIAFHRALRASRETGAAYRYWPLVYLTFLLLYNFTESATLVRNSVFWILFVAITCSLRRSGESQAAPEPISVTELSQTA